MGTLSLASYSAALTSGAVVLSSIREELLVRRLHL